MKRLTFGFAVAVLTAAAGTGLGAPAGSLSKTPGRAAPPTPKVLVATFSGIISPVAAEFFEQTVASANEKKVDALVLRIDTPGGLEASMRRIVQAVLASKVPVVAYVHPPGGRATSAGVFIVMAAHVAAMAPGTNIGAAHPVMIGNVPSPEKGKEKEKGSQQEIMEDKMASDAAAYLKSIAQERGRNEKWAYEAVQRSTSAPAQEAVALGVVDLVAPSLEELLKAIDGRQVQGLGRRLRTAGASVEHVEMTRRQRWLATLSDPNIAMILMSLGAAGVLIELYSPGLILPGVVGAVSLVLAFYSFQTLSANYAGVILMLLGFLMFIAEIKVMSYGLLSVGGVASVLLGILMLFDRQSVWGVSISWQVISGTLGSFLAFTGLAAALALRAHQRRPVTGAEGLVGQEGRTRTRLAPEGEILLQGEIWKAESLEGPIPTGAEVRVESIDGLKLKVRRAAAPN